MIKPRILIVEDEADIRRFVRMALEKEGMNVFETTTAEEARLNSGSRKPDLMIVDLGLPDGDGKTLIREVRNWISAPILVLSAREQETEKVEALDAGADDYLTKPFGVAELLARIRAQLRRQNRAAGADCSTVRFGEVEVDLDARIVQRAGEPVHLTPIEYRLLAALARHAGRVITQRQLLQEVWGPSRVDSAHYLRIYMGHLRQKLERDPAQPEHIVTETAIGYRLAGVR